MASFKYAAKDANGKTVEGTVQADDKSAAVAELRRQNLVVMKVEQGSGGKKAKKSGGASVGGFELFKAKPRASRVELVLFTRQLSTMISAGISLLEAIEVLGEQAERPGLKVTCEKLAAELRGGADLSSAMSTCPAVFSELYVSMVSAGEVSGQMDVILERLADYQEASDSLQREIKSAMTYPVISLVLVCGITAFLMLGVVPTFRQVFESLDSELPGITQFVLSASDFMKAHWLAMFGGMAASFGAIWAFKKTQKGALIFDHIGLKLPVFGILAKKIALARFSRTFATLIRSGVPIMGALDIVGATAGNMVVATAVDNSKDSVRNGNMLSEPLSNSPVFPPMVVRMIAIGERSGALEVLLEKIAQFYDTQVKAQIKSLTSMIEPLLITFMGGVVGLVVMAVFFPILDIVGKLSSS